MTVDLTTFEKDVLKMLDGEDKPEIIAGAALWTSIEYLKAIRLVQRQCTPGGITYEISREGKAYLAEEPMSEFRVIPCPHCDGTGERIVSCGPHQWDVVNEPCSACNGEGSVLAEAQPIDMDDMP